MAQPSPRVSLSDAVIEKLEEMISTMKPGDRLPTEMELSETFSVGRSTIRESMKVLTAKKMVVRRNEGTFVADFVNGCLVDPLNMIVNMNVGDVNSLLEVREILELNAIEMAAQRATQSDIQDLERANWLMQEPGLSPEVKQKRDMEFHATIAKITGNMVIVELLNAIRVVIAQKLELGDGDTMHTFPFGQEYHCEMIAAVADQDPEKARKCMQKYFASVYEALGI